MSTKQYNLFQSVNTRYCYSQRRINEFWRRVFLRIGPKYFELSYSKKLIFIVI